MLKNETKCIKNYNKTCVFEVENAFIVKRKVLLFKLLVIIDTEKTDRGSKKKCFEYV